MNDPHEQFDDFEKEMQRLEPVALSADAKRRMVEGAADGVGEVVATGEDAANEAGDVAPPRTIRLWADRRWMAVAACLMLALLLGILIPAFQPAQKFGSRDGRIESSIESVQTESREIGDWVIHPVANAQFVIHESSHVELDSGELRIESKSLAKPKASLRIETLDGKADLKGQGYYIVSHSPIDSQPESSSKGHEMKSLTKVLILTGAVTLTNAFGSIDGSSDTLLAAEKGKAPVAHVVKANSEFTFDLYKQLAEENKGNNLFFSPYSITSALAMTTEGARGNTAKQMGDVLRFPKIAQLNNAAQPWNTSVVHSGLGALNQRYNAADKPFELAIANAVWVEKTFPIRPQFTTALAKPYGVKMVNPVDFISNAEGERQRINGWVEGKTKERIKDLLPDRSLDTDTRVVLTNAIYFKGNWASQFKKSDTTDAPFKLADGGETKVPLMYQGEKEFRFATLKADGSPDRVGFDGRGDKRGFAIIELPYKGNELSMIAVAPNAVDGLADIETKLSHENLENWMARMHKTEVDVLLPKFKMTIEYKLNDTLKAMGMKDAFTPGEADFTGISDSPDASKLCISLVVHKAFVEVNEEGTEAAAATGVVLKLESAVQVSTFRADRPFLYFIRDNKTGSILFIGRVMDPTK